jgi:hypothetical protein
MVELWSYNRERINRLQETLGKISEEEDKELAEEVDRSIK